MIDSSEGRSAAHPASGELVFTAAHRVLVLAPHPDDETLATGELLQRALAAGASVRVVIATDGDNNPWPQRWLERRWTIDAPARVRWGQRRREESLRALDVLGVPRSAVHHLGWTDGSLTDRLMGDASAMQTLCGEITRFAPTHVALPVLDDRHPDHTALRVMAELAWTTGRAAPARRLGFVVHACGRDAPPVRASADGPALVRKLDALARHTSQLALSGKRMRGIALREERFESSLRVESMDAAGGFSLPLSGMHLRERELLLVAVADGRVWRGRVHAHVGTHVLAPLDAGTASLGIRVAPAHARLDLVFEGAIPALVYAKLHRRGSRLVIFDDDGWHVFARAAGSAA